MNKTLPLLSLLFLFCQCADKAATKTPAASSKTKQPALSISTANNSEYQQLISAELAISPIGRLCAESKGYNIDEWDALNECSWAIEKHQIEQYPELVSRKEDTLLIKTVDKILTLVHNSEKTGKYFQFIDYLPESNYFVMKIIQQSSCPEFWLISATNGHKIVLLGRPVFTKAKNAFLLSTALNKEATNCPNSLVFWSLRNGTFKKITEQATPLAVHNLYWEKENVWLGSSGDEVLRIRKQHL